MLLTSNHPFILLSKEFHEICKPLALVHIEHLTYLKQFNDGTRVALSSKPQWIFDYYNLNLYQSSLFEQKPSNYKSAFNVLTGEYDIEIYQYGRKVYNTADCISITEPSMDGCEHFLFSATPDKSEAIQYLGNNINILYHFISYLRDKGLSIFKSAEKYRFKVHESFIKSENIHTPISKEFNLEMEKNKQLFLNETLITRYITQNNDSTTIKLSQQEMACIFYMLQNKTSKETARILGISYRTVETYIDNVKLKLKCQNKFELVKRLLLDKYYQAINY